MRKAIYWSAIFSLPIPYLPGRNWSAWCSHLSVTGTIPPYAHNDAAIDGHNLVGKARWIRSNRLTTVWLLPLRHETNWIAATMPSIRIWNHQRTCPNQRHPRVRLARSRRPIWATTKRHHFRLRFPVLQPPFRSQFTNRNWAISPPRFEHLSAFFKEHWLRKSLFHNFFFAQIMVIPCLITF